MVVQPSVCMFAYPCVHANGYVVGLSYKKVDKVTIVPVEMDATRLVVHRNQARVHVLRDIFQEVHELLSESLPAVCRCNGHCGNVAMPILSLPFSLAQDWE